METGFCQWKILGSLLVILSCGLLPAFSFTPTYGYEVPSPDLIPHFNISSDLSEKEGLDRLLHHTRYDNRSIPPLHSKSDSNLITILIKSQHIIRKTVHSFSFSFHSSGVAGQREVRISQNFQFKWHNPFFLLPKTRKFFMPLFDFQRSPPHPCLPGRVFTGKIATNR